MTRQGTKKLGREWQGKARHNEIGQDRAGQGKKRLGRTGQDKASINRARQSNMLNVGSSSSQDVTLQWMRNTKPKNPRIQQPAFQFVSHGLELPSISLNSLSDI